MCAAALLLLLASLVALALAGQETTPFPDDQGPIERFPPRHIRGKGQVNRGFSYADLNYYCSAQSYSDFRPRNYKTGILTNPTPYVCVGAGSDFKSINQYLT